LRFPLSIPALGKIWRDAELPGGVIPPDRTTLRDMTHRRSAHSHFDSMRAGIGTALRSLHSGVLREPLPDRMAELLRQLDEQLRQLASTRHSVGE
jgi:hypothetical protein